MEIIISRYPVGSIRKLSVVFLRITKIFEGWEDKNERALSSYQREAEYP